MFNPAHVITCFPIQNVSLILLLPQEVNKCNHTQTMQLFPYRILSVDLVAPSTLHLQLVGYRQWPAEPTEHFRQTMNMA